MTCGHGSVVGKPRIWQVTNVSRRVRIGTRGSALAQRQTAIVADLLRAVWPGLTIEIQIISTYGDQVTDVPLPQMAGEGVFTNTLEIALRAGQIDVAVHSLKDLPVSPAPGVVIGAVPERANPADALVSRSGYGLANLPSGAAVGTCSRRRAAQLRYLRPDIQTIDIRGNVDTRIAKARAADGSFDAIVLACAGLERLGRTEVISEVLPLDSVLPAPGQAALGVQCRDEEQWKRLLAPINHLATETAVTAERTFLSALGGGCSLPVAAYACVQGNSLEITGRVIAPDGSSQIQAKQSYPFNNLSVEAGVQAGVSLAKAVEAQGAKAFLEGTT
ncbi:MAG: hydroxymethylbilane synthase [Anaerolineae bacterium]|nr:hydroxymethylbilane synthase [Anaerolineae bacterium]